MNVGKNITKAHVILRLVNAENSLHLIQKKTRSTVQENATM